MNVNVQIQFKDPKLIQEIFTTNEVEVGASIELEENCSVALASHKYYRALETQQILDLVCTLSSGVSIGLLSNWLYNKLKSKDAKLKIENVDIEIDNEKIKASFTKITKRQ